MIFKVRKLLIIISIIVTNSIYSGELLDNKNGTVTDNKTKLIWQKCNIGQENAFECSGDAVGHIWIHAMRACKNLNLAGKKWRLPSNEEFQTLVDIDYDFGIDTKFFHIPQENRASYWTSSNSTETGKGYMMNFNQGGVSFGYLKNISSYVRCVTGL